MKNKKCNYHSGTPNNLVVDKELVYSCNKKVKYRISYINPMCGKKIIENVCGIHYRQLYNMEKRLLKKCDFNIFLKIIKEEANEG